MNNQQNKGNWFKAPKQERLNEHVGNIVKSVIYTAQQASAAVDYQTLRMTPQQITAARFAASAIGATEVPTGLYRKPIDPRIATEIQAQGVASPQTFEPPRQSEGMDLNLSDIRAHIQEIQANV